VENPDSFKNKAQLYSVLNSKLKNFILDNTDIHDILKSKCVNPENNSLFN